MTQVAPIIPVILCGGAGTRLWPLSRKSYPKQFARIVGDSTLFEDCVTRLSADCFAQPVIVTGDPFRFIVVEQMQNAKVIPAAILIEPEARDTAPAILAAALHAAHADKDALILMAPSDHLIPDHAAFADTVRAAVPAALAGQIVTFGITPTRAETGYGYLVVDDLPDSSGLRPLAEFVEKPDHDAAQRLLASGAALWNAGIYLATARTLVQAFDHHAPQMLAHVTAALELQTADLGFTRLAPAPWSRIKGQSIDYAIMEKTGNLCVAPFDGAWSDLGDWSAVWRETQEHSVATLGATTALDCANTLLRSEVAGQTVVGIGLDDIVAVAMPDAVLISHKSRTQDVRQAVALMKARQYPQAETYPKDHRPWGWFESLASGNRFQVKRISVNPGAALSLQSHHHRAEHWIVVAGTAKVTVGNRVELVSENQSIYIPLGTRHRLENPGKLPVILIEVQTGAYLGEDDIIRHEDIYARA